MTTPLRAFLIFLPAFAAPSALAHPIPLNTYDRIVVVKLTPRGIVVDYRLHVDSQTAYADVPHLIPRSELRKLERPDDVLQAFVRASAKELAYNLYATVNGKAIAFTCTQYASRNTEHLVCDYTFEAAWPTDLPVGPRQFRFRESNYVEEKGAIDLALMVADELHTENVVQPDAELLARSPLDYLPGDADRLRTVEATVALSTNETPAAPSESSDDPENTSSPAFQSGSTLWVLAFSIGLAAVLVGVGIVSRLRLRRRE